MVWKAVECPLSSLDVGYVSISYSAGASCFDVVMGEYSITLKKVSAMEWRMGLTLNPWTKHNRSVFVLDIACAYKSRPFFALVLLGARF